MTAEPLASDTDDEEDDSPWLVALCPVSAELAAQIIGMAALDLDDHETVERAMAEAGWTEPGDEQGEYDAVACTPAGHLVYDFQGILVPFAHEYYVHPAGAIAEEEGTWGLLPGWTRLADPQDDEFDAAPEAVVDLFTELIGPPHHDLTHDLHPEFCRTLRHRIWRLGDNVLTVAEGRDHHTYSQFDLHYICLRPLAAAEPLPPVEELPEFFY